MTAITIPTKLFKDEVTHDEFNQLLNALKDGTRSILTESLTSNGEIASSKIKFTEDGGLAVKLTNRTGSESIKGYVVAASSTFDSAVGLYPVDTPNGIGVFLESGVADGQEAWIVTTGLAYVYFSGSTTRGYLARTAFSTDAAAVTGQAVSEAYPSNPAATDKHFGEIGHVLQSRTGAGLALCNLHEN